MVVLGTTCPCGGVGTFSVSGAIILRVLYAILGPDHPSFLLLYSDDGNFTAVGKR